MIRRYLSIYFPLFFMGDCAGAMEAFYIDISRSFLK